TTSMGAPGWLPAIADVDARLRGQPRPPARPAGRTPQVGRTPILTPEGVPAVGDLSDAGRAFPVDAVANCVGDVITPGWSSCLAVCRPRGADTPPGSLTSPA